MESKAPLLEQNTAKSRLPQRLGVIFLSLLLVGAGLYSFRTTEVDIEAPVAEFAVGEYKVGEAIGSTQWGTTDDETALKEGMFLPVEIQVDGEKEDASKIFWIGFTDDRKTKFKEQVTFKRHYEGPDCWSKWFNDVNKGRTEAKQVDLRLHAPND